MWGWCRSPGFLPVEPAAAGPELIWGHGAVVGCGVRSQPWLIRAGADAMPCIWVCLPGWFGCVSAGAQTCLARRTRCAEIVRGADQGEFRHVAEHGFCRRSEERRVGRESR